MHLRINQSFVSCQLVDGPKLQYQNQMLLPPSCRHLLTDKFRQRKYPQPATEDHHEEYLHVETLTERTYLDFIIFILPKDL